MIPRLTFGCGGRSHGGKWMMPFLITHKLIKEPSFNQETNNGFEILVICFSMFLVNLLQFTL
jgi:hypothetical protein